MKNKKVIHIITGLGRGGAEAMLYKVTSSQSDLCHIVISLTNNKYYEDRLTKSGVKVLYFTKDFLTIVKFISKSYYDNKITIMAWMYHAMIFSFLFSNKCKVIWNVRHSLDNLGKDRFRTRVLIRFLARLSSNVDVVTFNSFKSKNSHIDIGYSEINSIVIPNGFDTDFFKFDNCIDSEISDMFDKLPPNSYKLINVGRYHPVKGHDLLFDTLCELVRKGIDAYLFCFGDNVNDTNSRINLPDNIKHRVFLLGPRDNLSGIYPAFDIYVSSSYSEGFPNVIGEAMLSGLKVAATDVGDSKLIIDKYGEVCQVDSKELASCIESCLNLNFEAQSISNYISDCYSISAISKKFEEIY